MLNMICGRYHIKTIRPLIMGILNLTPDSLSDGGHYLQTDVAISAAYKMIEAGVDIIDIGAESTRPGAIPTPLSQELERILPVVKALRHCGKPLSIDTYKPEVMRAVLEIGVDIINDVRALRTPHAIDTVIDSHCAIVLMHMQGNPQNMQHQPNYQNVVDDITDFFQTRLNYLDTVGIERTRIILDPGFGFGKKLDHNLELLRGLNTFSQFNLPILAGLSRKAMLGELTNKPVNQREFSSTAATILAAEQGATILRVHNVPATLDALKIWSAVKNIPWQENIAILDNHTQIKH